MERDITDLLVKARDILKQEEDKYDINKAGEDDALNQLFQVDKSILRAIDTIYTYNENKRKGYYNNNNY